jgi:hypothetical protein
MSWAKMLVSVKLSVVIKAALRETTVVVLVEDLEEIKDKAEDLEAVVSEEIKEADLAEEIRVVASEVEMVEDLVEIRVAASEVEIQVVAAVAASK